MSNHSDSQPCQSSQLVHEGFPGYSFKEFIMDALQQVRRRIAIRREWVLNLEAKMVKYPGDRDELAKERDEVLVELSFLIDDEEDLLIDAAEQRQIARAEEY